MRLAWIMGVLAMATILHGCSPTPRAERLPPADQAPYALLPAAQLAAEQPRIDAFWRDHGVAGAFQGEAGVTIRFMRFRQPQPGPAVVIASGRTEFTDKYRELAFDFWRQGYSVYLHDHRGQGRSGRLLADKPQLGHVERFDDYVQDLHRFVQTEVEVAGHTVKFVVAHSMGGGIATRYLQQHPGVFRAAALSSPMHAPNLAPLGRLGCPWMWATAFVCRTCYAPLFIGGPYKKPEMEGNIYTTSPERFAAWQKSVEGLQDQQRLGSASRHWVAQACEAADAMLADVGKIKVPVMVLQSIHDKAVAPTAQDAFCAAMAQAGNPCKPQGRPVPYEAGHELFIERDDVRNDVVARMLAFFAPLHGV
jgi:lysophospholipase